MDRCYAHQGLVDHSFFMLGNGVHADEGNEEHAIVGGVCRLEDADDFPDGFVDVGLFIRGRHAVGCAEGTALGLVFLGGEFWIVKMQVQGPGDIAADDGLKFFRPEDSALRQLVALGRCDT